MKVPLILHLIWIYRVYSVFTKELSVTTTFLPPDCNENSQRAQNGDTVYVHYTGFIDDSSPTGIKGKIFDSSLSRDPFSFQLGAGNVIKGWDKGILGSCIGEKRTLIIPPELGYGKNGAGRDIPGGAYLKFNVELISIKNYKPSRNVFEEIDEDKDWVLTEYELGQWYVSTRGEDMPPDLFYREDLNDDGIITWEEFSGPKGSGPPKDL